MKGGTGGVESPAGSIGSAVAFSVKTNPDENSIASVITIVKIFPHTPDAFFAIISLSPYPLGVVDGCLYRAINRFMYLVRTYRLNDEEARGYNSNMFPLPDKPDYWNNISRTQKRSICAHER
jgi:hypothetical protein